MLPIAQALETAISGLYYGEHFNIWEETTENYVSVKASSENSQLAGSFGACRLVGLVFLNDVAIEVLCGACAGVSQLSRHGYNICSICQKDRSNSMPLRYNYDKPGKP